MPEAVGRLSTGPRLACAPVAADNVGQFSASIPASDSAVPVAMKTILDFIARKRAAASVRTINVLDSSNSRTLGFARRIAATAKAITSSDVSAPSMKDSGCPRSLAISASASCCLSAMTSFSLSCGLYCVLNSTQYSSVLKASCFGANLRTSRA
ncbi:hypothetical protein D3C81_991130 [compost metagenome]